MKGRLAVAAPWSLSHYIPLNGFHPLYRALFDYCPDSIAIHAWDNVELSHHIRADGALRAAVIAKVRESESTVRSRLNADLTDEYIKGFFPPNIALTAMLPGQIEFHHTAPFPSLTRPFVLHCESFAPIFFPFSHQGTGNISRHRELKQLYGRIFKHDMCLGIFSHIPTTLSDVSAFFKSKEIDAKLFESRIGLSNSSFIGGIDDAEESLHFPRFLFINSANQNPANFFHRGGHIVLRFWKELLRSGHKGKLYMRCLRPRDEQLSAHGVDIEFVRSEDNRTIVWIQDYLSNKELNELMRRAHFFLLPSASLHSVSIMQAMASGTVPVVTDTVGVSVYVADELTGIVLNGVYSTNWKLDSDIGIHVDQYQRSDKLDDSLVEQLTRRILALLAAPHVYNGIRTRAVSTASDKFSGSSFNEHFWEKLQELNPSACEAKHSIARRMPPKKLDAIAHCQAVRADWPRMFESVTQPVTRIYTGFGRVSEVGGCYVHVVGNPGMELHDWSVLSEYCVSGAPRLNYASSLKDLGGRFMSWDQGAATSKLSSMVVERVATYLSPYPALYRTAAHMLKTARRVRRRLGGYKKIETQKLDIQLVVPSVSGMNVIRCFDKYYAIPQSEGEFLLSKVLEGGYSVSFSGNSVKQVLRKIAEFDVSKTGDAGTKNSSGETVELVEEGVRGFNIVRFEQRYYAIPQGEGAFSTDRITSGGYTVAYSHDTLTAIKSMLIERHS